MRALIALLFLGCAGRPPAEAPSWQKKAVGGDCEISIALSVPEATAPAPKVVGRGMTALSRLADAKIPSGKRLEVCARMRPERGADWIVVVREIAVDEATRLASSGELLPSGAVRSRSGSGSLFVWERVWAIASESAAARVQHLGKGDVASPIALPNGTIGALSIRGEAAHRIQQHLVEGTPLSHFVEAVAEVRLNGDHLTVRARLRFDSEDDARRLAAAIEDGWRRAGDQAARGDKGELADLRRDAELKVDRVGVSVDTTLDVWEEGTRRAAPAATAPKGTYDETCSPGGRFDLDEKSCVP
ncbi:MAG: hypothetical protein KIS78_05875 [Labilithrix sp.]|nr:hypothetical protein [Labilithrix sp.]